MFLNSCNNVKICCFLTVVKLGQASLLRVFLLCSSPQGVYLTSSAKEMADMLDMESVQKQEIPDPDLQVVYSAKGILPASSVQVCSWIKARTLEWLKAK